MFANTRKSFEEVCLRFIQLEQTDALKVFLLKKLGTLSPKVCPAPHLCGRGSHSRAGVGLWRAGKCRSLR